MPTPSYIPDEKTAIQVEALASIGVPQNVIATHLEIGNESTLQKYYREALDKGYAKKKIQIAKWIFEDARAGDKTMRIFLAKTQLGWNEVHKLEHSGNINVTPVINNVISASSDTAALPSEAVDVIEHASD